MTQYGRSLSAELLSTWSYEGESSPGHYDIGWPSWLAVGGDGRYLNIAQETENEPSYRFIPMQRDLELALHLGQVWIGGSYGIYNDKTSESRRHYLILQNVAERFNLRVGKFTVAYGLAGADHTAFNRGPLGLGQGDESYNAEISAEASIGTVILSGIALTKEIDEKGQPHYTSKSSGIAGRITLFALKKAQVGLSAMLRTEDLKYGGFLSTAPFRWLYAGADVNTLWKDGEKTVYSWGKLSAEAYRGVNLVYENNYSRAELSQSRQNNIGLDFFPRPHLQFYGKVMNTNGLLGYLLLSHYYW